MTSVFIRYPTDHLTTGPIFVCGFCNEDFTGPLRKRNHQRHVNVVHMEVLKMSTVEDPSVCPICGKTFTLKGHCKRHVRSVHQKITRYECSYCAKKFYRKSDRNKHERDRAGKCTVETDQIVID